MTRFGLKAVTALFLLLVASVIAACTGGASNPTPTPGATPRTTATPDPNTTPTPDLADAIEVLSEARSVLTAVESLYFGFTLAGPTRTLQGTGAWTVPGDFRLSVEAEACPPVMEGVPAPDECAFVPAYEAVGVGDVLYSHGGSGEWSEAARTDDGWALGPWSQNFDVEQFNLPIGPAPSALANAVLDRIAAAEGLTATEGTLDETDVYYVAGEDAGIAYELFIEQETYRVLQVVLTMHPENPTVWTWTFWDHNEPVTIMAGSPGQPPQP